MPHYDNHVQCLKGIDDDDDLKCISGIFYSALTGGRGIEVLDILNDSGVDFTVPV